MALASEKHNFIFIHIYRTGGNSVRKSLGAPAVGCVTDLLNGIEVLGVHANITDVQQYYNSIGKQNFFDHAHKFTVVRNPFSWLVSVYKYIKFSPGHNFHKVIRSKSYLEFLNWYVNVAMTTDRPFGANKYQTLQDFITDVDGNVLVDQIAKTEYMQKSLRRIHGKLGIKVHTATPDINKTRRDDWKSYYTDHKCIQFVETHFEQDLIRFNYTWS